MTAPLVWPLVRAVPATSPLRPLVVTAVVGSAFVVSSSAGAAPTRFRLAAAAVAATAAFVLDDDAAITLAATPVTLLRRRLARLGVAATFVAAWVSAAALVLDARTGVGRPALAALLEVVAVAAIAAAAACLAMRFSDDARGGATGAIAALLCSATVYLPSRWWLPLTARPETTRLLVIAALAAAVTVAGSADPARRRRIA